MNDTKKSEGTSWKRRRHAIVAGVALVALSAVGSSAISGTGSATITKTRVSTVVVEEPETGGGTTQARAGWGG